MTKRGSQTRARPTRLQAKSKASPADARQRRVRPAKGSSARGLSRDQKLDVTGVLLTLTGTLLMLAMFSPSQSALIELFLRLLELLFGWGRFLVPCALVGLGAWIVLRHFSDRLPVIGADNVLGGALLYLAGLTASHYFHFPDSPRAIQALISTGQGGGRVGGYLMQVLVHGLGPAGAGVAIASWILIALLLTLGVSTRELLSTLGSWRRRLAASMQAEQGARVPLRGGNANALPPGVSDPNALHQDPPDDATVPNHEPAPIDESVNAHESSDSNASRGKANVGAVDGSWELPSLSSMLDVGSEMTADDEHDRLRALLIEETLDSFGAPGRVVEVNRGPVVTQFGVEPDYVVGRNAKRTRVKVNKISALSKDLALALAAPSIRIEAPAPGRGFVGIEVPNATSDQVALRDVIDTKAFASIKSPLAMALGQDVSGNAVCADLASMPHLLVAGTTGSGKSVCINAIITTLLLHNTPEHLKLMLIDPKRVELTAYNSVPHLMAPVVVDLDRIVHGLQWVTREMDSRYDKFAKVGARNITDFNKRAGSAGLRAFPNLVVVVDELADLMMIAPDETERIVTRLAQLSRATGIHLIIATQRPSVDVLTGLIKANFPARISFAVASSVDSRVIIDQSGAERLLGRGDMLFLAPDSPQPLRMQGAFVSETESDRLVSFWKKAGVDRALSRSSTPSSAEVAGSDSDDGADQSASWEEIERVAMEEARDDRYEEAAGVVRELRKASISLLQRRLRIGYTRAAKLIDALEEAGVIGPPKAGAQQRQVLDYGQQLVEPVLPTDER